MSLYAAMQEVINADSTDTSIQEMYVDSPKRLMLSTVPALLQDTHIGEQGVQLIEYFEGCRLTSYQDSKGIWTIGLGHTGNIKPRQTITHAQAVKFFADDITWAENFIKNHITRSLLQNQFDALVSFTFNVGVGNFLHSSVLTNINAGRFDLIPHSLCLWNQSGGHVITGLVTRRHAEAVLFSFNKLEFSPVHTPDDWQA